MGESPISPGTYRHFKGNLYRVHGVARHSETEEEFVVYEPLYGDSQGKWFVRPLSMFIEEVDKPELGYRGPRFTKVEE